MLTLYPLLQVFFLFVVPDVRSHSRFNISRKDLRYMLNSSILGTALYIAYAYMNLRFHRGTQAEVTDRVITWGRPVRVIYVIMVVLSLMMLAFTSLVAVAHWRYDTDSIEMLVNLLWGMAAADIFLVLPQHWTFKRYTEEHAKAFHLDVQAHFTKQPLMMIYQNPQDFRV